MTTLTPNELPSDTAVWLAQIRRHKDALATAISSMPWAPARVLGMLDYAEQECRNAAIARHVGDKRGP